MKKQIFIALGAVLVVLLIPLIAMQFSDQVNWSFVDFIVAGIILLVGAFGIILIRQLVKDSKKRLIGTFILVLLLFLFFVQLAVGIFGTPLSGS